MLNPKGSSPPGTNRTTLQRETLAHASSSTAGEALAQLALHRRS